MHDNKLTDPQPEQTLEQRLIAAGFERHPIHEKIYSKGHYQSCLNKPHNAENLLANLKTIEGLK